jgi:hypothetical protein
MTLRIRHRGYSVKAVSIPLRDGTFTSHGSIMKHRGFATDDILFETGERHPTPSAAAEAGIGFAIRKIDSR